MAYLTSSSFQLNGIGELNFELEFDKKEIIARYGGSDVCYRYYLTIPEFCDFPFYVWAIVRNEPWIEFEFVSLQTVDGDDVIFNSEGHVNAGRTMGDMRTQLENLDVLEELNIVFYR